MPNPKKITMPDNVRNQLIIQLRGFDARHYANTERYARQIDRVYKTACDEYARLGASLDAPEGEAVFSFDKYPRARKQAQGIMQRLAKKVESVITSGTQSEWLAATYKNDAFLGSILRTSKLTKEELEQYQGRNLEALNTFQRRKVEGMGLSERVWKQAEDMKAAIELGIDVAIGDGRDAQQLSRDLRSYLQEPKRLYRRVRDKGGVLRLSKAAKMYHPGQGVYRSSAKNAQRLARTEINMAYRESEFLRWQKLDFVVGLRICLSNNHTIMNSKGEPVPLVDICDELWGDYPKTFKFVGWHPQCRCYVVPILSDYDEYNQDRANRLKAIVRGTAYKSLPSRRSVVDVPRKFREYIDSILERSKGWKSQPYYIRDNFVGGKIEGGLNPIIPTKTMNTVQPCTEFDGRIAMLKRWAYAFGLDLSNVESLRTAGNRAALLAEVERLDELGTKRQSAWQDAYTELYYFAQNEAKGNKEITDICEKELRDNAITTSHYYGDCTSKLKAAFSEVVAKFAKIKAEEAKIEYSKNMPEALQKGKEYLDGEDYVFRKDFFDLLKEKPTLKIPHTNKGSYETDHGKTVVLDSVSRGKASKWEKISVVYHEFGHAIADQRDLLYTDSVQELRKKQIARLRKRVTIKTKEKVLNKKTWEYEEKEVTKQVMKAKAVSDRLDRLYYKIKSMNPEIFTKRGITKDDVIEQIAAVQDTLKSLINSVGWGHSTKYFNYPGMSEHEYLAHCFENTFIGNRIFQKYLPTEYAEMIDLIQSLKF